MRGGELLFVTQVAAYASGPAGVHGVLDQAAVGVAECAELADLRAARVDDVRDLDHDRVESARALALFTIGQTPWSAAQRAAITRRVRARELAALAIHSASDSCYGWADYGRFVGARFDGHPWTQTVDLQAVDPAPPA